MTALAAADPGPRAARVAPVQAMRESGPAEDRSLRRRTIIGRSSSGSGSRSRDSGLRQGSSQLVGLGAVLTFLGVATAVATVRPSGRRACSARRSPGSDTGRIGRGNAMRSPRRTSATAAALMIGLALVAAVSTIGAEREEERRQEIVDTSLGADYVLHADQFMPFSPEVARRCRASPSWRGRRLPLRLRPRSPTRGASDVQGVNPPALRGGPQADHVEGLARTGCPTGGWRSRSRRPRNSDLTGGGQGRRHLVPHRACSRSSRGRLRGQPVRWRLPAVGQGVRPQRHRASCSASSPSSAHAGATPRPAASGIDEGRRGVPERRRRRTGPSSSRSRAITSTSCST